tara:strand:- start:7688 stop:7795 length:108 start_codon:yes stop_codon:yes gene_type:complete
MPYEVKKPNKQPNPITPVKKRKAVPTTSTKKKVRK